MRPRLWPRVTLAGTCQAKARYPTLREAKEAARRYGDRKGVGAYAYECNNREEVVREDRAVRLVRHFHTATRLPDSRRKE